MEPVVIFADPFLTYPEKGPFAPPCEWPEYPFKGSGCDPHNHVYGAVRELLRLLRADPENEGTQLWNPLKGVVTPGDFVVVKPNAVVDHNFEPSEPLFACVTHMAVVRAILDYVIIALKGRGEVVVADAPIAETRCDLWKERVQWPSIEEFYRVRSVVPVSLVDLRQSECSWDGGNDYNPEEGRRVLPGDPRGYVVIDLGDESKLRELSPESASRLYGADYQVRETRAHHAAGRNEYCLAGTVVHADVLINIPKMKTHQKCGVTLGIKNLVGTQGNKNYIPHFRVGTPKDGGDECPDGGMLQTRLIRCRTWCLATLLGRRSRNRERLYCWVNRWHRRVVRIVRCLQRIRYVTPPEWIQGGSWIGNDTVWRAAMDLAFILTYVNKRGEICSDPQRKMLTVIDGIVGGEGEGPLAARGRCCGTLVAGMNVAAVDAVGARLMGFSPKAIPLVHNALVRDGCVDNRGAVGGIEIRSNIRLDTNMVNNEVDPYYAFLAPTGWRGYIEVGRREERLVH